MKGLACPCPALPKFLELGTCLMAEGSRTQAPGQGPPVNIQFLRAQYEGLRKQQRTQAHLMVFPKGRAGRVLQRGELLWVELGGTESPRRGRKKLFADPVSTEPRKLDQGGCAQPVS